MTYMLAIAVVAAAPALAATKAKPKAKPAAAATPAASDNPARHIIADRLGTDLTVKQVAVLNLVAHATAASVVCDSIDMNEEAVKGALTAVINESLPDLPSDADKGAFRDRILVGFGALTGLMIDEAAPKQASFCKVAEEEMNEEGTKSFIKPAAKK
jgi:hypothetical protein